MLLQINNLPYTFISNGQQKTNSILISLALQIRHSAVITLINKLSETVAPDFFEQHFKQNVYFIQKTRRKNSFEQRTTYEMTMEGYHLLKKKLLQVLKQKNVKQTMKIQA